MALHEEPGAVEHVLGEEGDVLLCQEGPAAGIGALARKTNVAVSVLQVGTKNLEDCCVHSEETYMRPLRSGRQTKSEPSLL